MVKKSLSSFTKTLNKNKELILIVIGVLLLIAILVRCMKLKLFSRIPYVGKMLGGEEEEETDDEEEETDDEEEETDDEETDDEETDDEETDDEEEVKETTPVAADNTAGTAGSVANAGSEPESGNVVEGYYS